MEAIIRKIIDLADNERAVIERFVGKRLANQRIVVQELDGDADVIGQRPRTAIDYAILADLDAASMERFDEAIQR